MKETANIWEYKIGINAIIAQLCMFVKMLIERPLVSIACPQQPQFLVGDNSLRTFFIIGHPYKSLVEFMLTIYLKCDVHYVCVILDITGYLQLKVPSSVFFTCFGCGTNWKIKRLVWHKIKQLVC